MESLLRPNGQAALCSAHTAYCVECAQNIFGRREAISYAVIIYSSLGMEEEAFTGMINIFGLNCARPAGHLSPQPASHYLRCAFRKAHRLIGDITQLDSPFILQFISTPRLGGVWINLFLGCCGELPPESNIIFKKDCCTVQDPRYLH